MSTFTSIKLWSNGDGGMTFHALDISRDRFPMLKELPFQSFTLSVPVCSTKTMAIFEHSPEGI
jgi:hypothetical protein